MKIALCVEYDGSDYSGWQKQNDVDSIQGEIEKALESIALEKIDTYASAGLIPVFMRLFRSFILKLQLRGL